MSYKLAYWWPSYGKKHIQIKTKILVQDGCKCIYILLELDHPYATYICLAPEHQYVHWKSRQKTSYLISVIVEWLPWRIPHILSTIYHICGCGMKNDDPMQDECKWHMDDLVQDRCKWCMNHLVQDKWKWHFGDFDIMKWAWKPEC